MVKGLKLSRVTALFIIIITALFLSSCAGSGGGTGEPKPAPEVPQAESHISKPHVMSEVYRDIYGDGFEETFFCLCDAVLSGEDTFSCPSRERLFQALSVSRTCLPIADALVDRDGSFVENGTAHLSYKAEKEELTRLTEEFKKTVEGNVSVIAGGDGECIKAIKLLYMTAHKNTFDEENTLDDFLSVTPYRAITQNSGICQELAGEYIYYLLQAGVDAMPCSALSRDKSEAHEWALVRIDGKYYHVDPTFTLSYPDSLYFFGMTDRQREYYGDFPPESFTYADADIKDTARFRADDGRFRELWLARSYEIDEETKTVTYTDTNTGEKKSFAYGS
ncbi:MAG: transglutaminase domain-containing protein [Clostridia bacterium]|nr:transglutaminase domain-containing protein [Clostridia bacterium]